MRRFLLDRLVDASGVSGTGIVAEGLQFSSGVCVLQWLTQTPGLAMYHSIEHVERVHGHGGQTRIVWIDPEK